MKVKLVFIFCKEIAGTGFVNIFRHQKIKKNT